VNQVNSIGIALQAAATINGSAIHSQTWFKISAQIVITGTATGTFKIQASQDDTLGTPNAPTNWNDITGATVAVAGAGCYLIPSLDCCYQNVRLVYTNGSGSGTMVASIKSLGG
jgi:hypothetical protein